MPVEKIKQNVSMLKLRIEPKRERSIDVVSLYFPSPSFFFAHIHMPWIKTASTMWEVLWAFTKSMIICFQIRKRLSFESIFRFKMLSSFQKINNYDSNTTITIRISNYMKWTVWIRINDDIGAIIQDRLQLDRRSILQFWWLFRIYWKKEARKFYLLDMWI